MSKNFLAFVLACLVTSLFLSTGTTKMPAESTPLDSSSSHLGKSDLTFFFDCISFQNGEWHFTLSKNSVGLLWRTIDGKKDFTGVCDYNQTLVVSKSASLELRNRDISIRLLPADPGLPNDPAAYYVWLRIGAGTNALYRGGYATVLEEESNGSWVVGNGED
jgi:hypothetical protein